MDASGRRLFHIEKDFKVAQRRAEILRKEGYRTDIRKVVRAGDTTFEVYAGPKLLKFNEAKRVYREPTLIELAALEK